MDQIEIVVSLNYYLCRTRLSHFSSIMYVITFSFGDEIFYIAIQCNVNPI